MRPRLPPRFRGLGSRYVVFGLINTAFGFLVFATLDLTLGPVIPYLVVLTLSTVVSVVEAYALQRRFVFTSTNPWIPELLRFSSVYAVSLSLNIPMLAFGREVLRLPVLLAQTLALGILTVGTFFVHRLFTFRARSGPHHDVQVT